MKKLLYSLLAPLAAGSLQAEQLTEPSPTPTYVAEAPLPEGWPQPGPFNQVSVKEYPAYRAAFTSGGGRSGAFWKLFLHIQKQGIPMTAPVAMSMEPAEDGKLARNSMAFLYQNGQVGTPGEDWPNIEVRDAPPTTALSYAWQGPDSAENLTTARTALEAEMKKRNIQARSFRLLGYNGPGTPRNKATWELQVLLPTSLPSLIRN